MGERIIVAGASLGGLRAAEQLRSAGWDGEITVVGEEAHPPYNRPPLSKEVLAAPGTPEEALASLTFRPKRNATGIQWRLGTRITGSNLAAGTLTLEDGEELGFNGLVVATGLRPRRVQAPGPLAGRFILRTLDDALALHAALVPGARVSVIGSGFIGCETAATAASLGCEVTLVEGRTGPMERPLGSALSRGVRALLTGRGIDCRRGVSVIRYRGTESCTGLELSDGTLLHADVVVEAVGSMANTEWLEGNDLDLGDGVECDRHLRVLTAAGQPVPGVVAVGDIARYPDVRNALPARRVEHWATPSDTAKIAAPALVAAINGLPPAEAAAPLPTFWTDIFGTRINGIGSPAHARETRVLEGNPAHPQAGVAMGYYRDNTLIGVVNAGLPASRNLHYRQLVLDAGVLVTT
ncbi:NAD(P)/FAD-dependent oxidoreductase [Paeniglutamicibacter kerguelensis]|uniref:NADPH-dependent 2,4-dienoyl-CoA reductase/sulfur reductase-like enzyme n=1 Tax=Paeniglutamicibacter kerguelensis TaxID=254788 RepID=A0ABS4X8A8_9MICC|nr:NAD(P)/FAD-dependent oxidoreductase [Paeniglutamicibacter kerguelensis]MBP2384705.1 NADPH-dependent 2,4-dienoyl-CoA reductase/sulfur reductase-like enzyme [Paeniglutamicibacter kerguelensis]